MMRMGLRDMDPAIPGDKRAHPRIRVEGATSMVGKPGILASLGFGPIRHPIVNISQGGALLRLGKGFPVGSRHELFIEIPNYQTVVETLGEVRWCAQSAKNSSDFFVGIQFVDLPPADRQKIAGITEKPGNGGGTPPLMR